MSIVSTLRLSTSVLSCIVAFFATKPVCSQLIDVGRQPVGIYPVGDVVHILCNQVDQNFNGVRDDGDAPASWWIVDAAGRNEIAHINFEWGGLGFPIRPDFNISQNRLYLSHLGRVRSFDLATQELADDTVARMRAASVHYDVQGERMLLGVRPGMFNDSSKVVAQYAAGSVVGQTVAYRTRSGIEGLAILNEGPFGVDASTLQLYTDGGMRELAIGGTGNHLYASGDSLFVTMNGSHEVHIIDLSAAEIVKSIPTGTTGIEGPRESVVVGDVLYVTTYSGDVRKFSIATGELEETQPTGGKAEGLAILNETLWVANVFEPESFTSANAVAVFELDESIEPIQSVEVAPQPLVVIPFGGQVHVLCNQIDLDFDGVQDQEDQPASWWLINPDNFSAVHARNFNWGGFGFPLRIGVNQEQGQLYIGEQSGVNVYDMFTQELVRDQIAPLAASAVSYDTRQNRLIYSVRSRDAAGNGRVYAELPTHLTVGQIATPTTSSGEKLTIILNEGLFGAQNSQLHIIADGASVFLDLGDTGNHMHISGDSAFVTVNGSHRVHIVDLDQLAIVRSIETGTEGANGPRESIVVDNELFVATYSDDVRRFSIPSGEMIERFEPGGKPESLAFVDGEIWITNSFEAGTFNSGSTIAVWDVYGSVGVTQEYSNVGERIVIMPNPVRSGECTRISVDGIKLSDLEITLYSLRGAAVAHANASVRHFDGGSAFDFVAPIGAPAGKYIVEFRTPRKVIKAPLLIVK